MDGWMDGWMGGWMGVKDVLRIAYSNKNEPKVPTYTYATYNKTKVKIFRLFSICYHGIKKEVDRCQNLKKD
jgi:hypothetical protein